LEVGSLILILPVDLPTVLLTFFGGAGAVVALCLLARVLEDPALEPTVESSANSPLGDRDEIGMAGIMISPSKPGIGKMKLSKVCTQRFKE
jgi:membrane protein implicated in regulation of membrane protease activity